MKLQPSLLAALLLPVFVLPALASSTSGGYNITTLNVPNARGTSPTAINSAGQIVGTFYGNSAAVYGFLYQSGVFTTINCPNAQDTNPLAISDSGIVYGTCGNSYSVFQYVISTGQLTTAPTQVPAGYPSLVHVSAISPAGEVFEFGQTNLTYQVFQYSYPNGPPALLAGAPSRQMTATEITGANSSGEFVGASYIGFQYLDGVYTQITQLTMPTGVGPSGQLVGAISTPGQSNQTGAVYQDGLVTLLQVPSALGYSPTATAINASGTVVGTYLQSVSPSPQGFIATPITAPANEESAIHIDSPNSTSGTLFASYQLTGWAIDNTSGIDVVNILVDGAFMGTTTTTLSRPDVCAAFPNQSGCPTVGWQYMLDTANLADGPHTLETVAISNTGQRAKTSAFITVGNAGQTASPLKLTIDTPTPQNPVSGQVTISGWAEDPGSDVLYVLLSFDVTVRGSSPFVSQSGATTGISRPDVCAAFPGDLHCPNVGWSYILNSTNLTNGSHTMTVVAYAANGDQTLVTKTFTVANSGALKLYIDQPATSSGTLSRQTSVSGWAFDPNSHIASVSAVVDGLTTINLNFGSSRPDVCAATPRGPDCPNVGWSGSLDTTQLANGAHTLSVTAVAQNGDSFRSQPFSFAVNNPASGNTTHADIDTPSPANQQFAAGATFSGWALDDATPIQRLDFLIDGNVAAAGGYYFTARPDVCAVFPNRPNCPNVGWIYSLNTSVLSNGNHTVTVRAVSETNSQASASATFTVNNELGPYGTKLFIDSPADGSAPLSAQTTVTGWALNDSAAISAVNASIDAGPAILATYNQNRPDVCQAYPGSANCPNVGWSFVLDTTQWADGVHRLNVTATISAYDGSGPGATQSVFFTVANAGASSPIASYIDTPTAATPTLSGVTSFSGWSIDQTTTIANVAITVDGIPFGLATYGGSRPDVCAGFPQYAGCPAGAIGWSFAIDTTALVSGSHTLAVTSASNDGRYHTITSTFSTAN